MVFDLSKKIDGAAISSPFEYYSSKAASGSVFGAIPDDKNPGAQSEAFLKQLSLWNPNSFDNNMEEQTFSRDMRLMQLTKPVEFLSAKNKVFTDLQDLVKGARKSLFQALTNARIKPVKAESAASAVASQMWVMMQKFLDTEIFPSVLENEIIATKAKLARKATNPRKALKKVTEKKLIAEMV